MRVICDLAVLRTEGVWSAMPGDSGDLRSIEFANARSPETFRNVAVNEVVIKPVQARLTEIAPQEPWLTVSGVSQFGLAFQILDTHWRLPPKFCSCDFGVTRSLRKERRAGVGDLARAGADKKDQAGPRW